MKKHFLITLVALLAITTVVLCLKTQTANAQEIGSVIASPAQIDDKDATDGSLVSFREGGYVLSDRAYDPTGFAVIVLKPALSVEDLSTPNAFPLISKGKVYVQVSSLNGEIKEEDLITTSERKGVGQKATQDGMVIGTAVEGYDDPDAIKVGKILVNLNFGFSTQTTSLRSNLLESLDLALSSPFISPANALRYIIAGIVVLSSLVVGIWFFGRVAAHGVEALGRNPMASRQILIGVSLNLILSLATFAIGIAIGYLILAL
ncbi:MAG TPA: hypothetical protein VJC10_00115 [Patescibacteria group bacterium]|nr:hypothetical protein [Patescibacteria group bacterium]